MKSRWVPAMGTAMLITLAGCSGGDDDSPSSTTGLCPWEHATGTGPPFVLTGTTALEAGDVALVIRTSANIADERCGGWFVAARAPISKNAAGGGEFELSVPAPPPPGSSEVAEAWPEELARSPRVVSGSIVALKPGTPDHLDQAAVDAQIAFVALDVVVYAYSAVPGGDGLFASWLYGPLAPGHHQVKLTEILTTDELQACLSATELRPDCICWYSTPGSTQGYGYCSIATRTPIAAGTPVAVNVPYSGANLYSL